MTHASLFSGIGAADLASEWMGWDNVFHCEWDKDCQRILKHYWPKAISYGNIKETDFTKHRGTIDVLSGGFPCQPYSAAGKRKGKEDDRHLWPEFLRAIREIQPVFILGENVRGLLNWNGGMVFSEVCAEMESEGFEVLPCLLPAAMVKAPHGRDRIFFVAFSASNSRRNELRNEEHRTRALSKERPYEFVITTNPGSNGHELRGLAKDRRSKETGTCLQKEWQWIRGNVGRIEQSEYVTHTHSDQRSEGRLHKTGHQEAERYFSAFDPQHAWYSWENFPTEWPIRSSDDGLSNELDGITISNWHKMTIKQSGNSMVPQLIYKIFKAIEISKALQTRIK